MSHDFDRDAEKVLKALLRTESDTLSLFRELGIFVGLDELGLYYVDASEVFIWGISTVSGAHAGIFLGRRPNPHLSHKDIEGTSISEPKIHAKLLKRPWRLIEAEWFFRRLPLYCHVDSLLSPRKDLPIASSFKSFTDYLSRKRCPYVSAHCSGAAGHSGYKLAIIGFDGIVSANTKILTYRVWGTHIETVQQLLRQLGGWSWWKRNGSSFMGVYYLTPSGHRMQGLRRHK